MIDLEVYREIIKRQGLNGKKMAEKLGISYSAYRGATRPNNPNPPMWIKAFLVGYELGDKNINND